MNLIRCHNRKICAAVFLGVVAFLVGVLFLAPGGYRGKAILSNPGPESCTIFTASHGDTVLFGNNEDWINPNTYYWVVPPRGQNYGVVFLGFDNFWPQGGINEKGLAYDINALPKAPLNPHPELPRIKKPFYAFLKTCATVEEVIDRVKQYSWERSWKAQVHLADRTGDAVVISAGPDGEITFTRKSPGNGYLISTNFNRANPKNGRYPCRRYDTAAAMLEKIQTEDDLTVEMFRSVLDAVHQESPSVNTVYSNIFDLKNGIIYLYHWHRFDEVVTLEVAAEIARAPSPTPIQDLFSTETVEKSSKAFRRYQKMVNAWKSPVWGWFSLAGFSLAVLVLDLALVTRTAWGVRLIWVLTVALFGPFGIIAYRLACRQPLRSVRTQTILANWRCALGETTSSVARYTVGIILAYMTIFYILPFRESSLLSLTARFYGFPLIIGFLFIHAPVLASVVRNHYWAVVRSRFLITIISLNFILCGLLPVSAILLDRSERYLGLASPANVLFWGIMVAGGFAGALLVYPFWHDMARRGFSSWPFVLHGGQAGNTMKSPSLRDVWGFLLGSIMLLVGAVIVMFSGL